MKKFLCLAASLLALNLTLVLGQPAPMPAMPSLPTLPPPSGTTFQQRLQTIQRGTSPQNEVPILTKFNLDFPGGTPAELVKAIEKAMGKPLNVIISPDEKSAKAELPPIKVTDMDVARLFRTLSENSRQFDETTHQTIKSEGFFTQDGNPTDNSLWTFSVYEKPSVLTKFDLNFPGGTPAQLVSAIEKATGKPLNVVIPDADADTKLPPLKMDNVDVAGLFQALAQASIKTVTMNTGPSPFGRGGSSYSTFTAGYGFKTEGQPADNSIWYFHTEKPTLPPVVPNEKACQFYSLSPYLDRGFTVDDITTAIQTGWKMADVTPTPELSYHKETKMLIAYGEPDKLQTIGNVLKALPEAQATFGARINDELRKLQKQVDQLNEQLNPPPEDSDPAYRRLMEKRQLEMNVLTNASAEKSGK